jgi:hypothetical protein rflaF_18846
MIQMEIYEEFALWLDDLLENNDMPEKTAAFCFNLYEESDEDCIYAIQLIAADRFDEEDNDWPCDEIWSSEEDIFCIDISDEEEKDWKGAQERFKEMAVHYLEVGKYRNVLIQAKAVGMGFVDGELEIISRN